MMKQIVLERKSDFLAAFRDADYNSLNVVCKEDFESILSKFNIRMDKEMVIDFLMISWKTKSGNFFNILQTRISYCVPKKKKFLIKFNFHLPFYFLTILYWIFTQDLAWGEIVFIYILCIYDFCWFFMLFFQSHW